MLLARGRACTSAHLAPASTVIAFVHPDSGLLWRAAGSCGASTGPRGERLGPRRMCLIAIPYTPLKDVYMQPRRTQRLRPLSPLLLTFALGCGSSLEDAETSTSPTSQAQGLALPPGLAPSLVKDIQVGTNP